MYFVPLIGKVICIFEAIPLLGDVVHFERSFLLGSTLFERSFLTFKCSSYRRSDSLVGWHSPFRKVAPFRECSFRKVVFHILGVRREPSAARLVPLVGNGSVACTISTTPRSLDCSTGSNWSAPQRVVFSSFVELTRRRVVALPKRVKCRVRARRSKFASVLLIVDVPIV